jgi:hypothetical protein
MVGVSIKKGFRMKGKLILEFDVGDEEALQIIESIRYF